MPYTADIRTARLENGQIVTNDYDSYSGEYQYNIYTYDDNSNPIYVPNYNYRGSASYADACYQIHNGGNNTRLNLAHSPLISIPDVLRNTTFDYCSFNLVDLTGREFLDCSFSSCYFDSTILNDVKFTRCSFSDTAFRTNRMNGVEFRSCQFDGGILNGSELNASSKFLDTVFTGTIIESVSGTGSNWQGITFNRCSFCYNTFISSAFKDIQFNRTSVSNITFERATLLNVASDRLYVSEDDGEYNPYRSSRSNHINTNGAIQKNSCFLLVVKGRIVKCRGCGVKVRSSQLKHSGIKLCKKCVNQKGYSERNDTYVGSASSMPSFGIEFEMDGTQDDSEIQAPLQLIQHGFIRTYDASVGDEYKSPIFLDMRSFRHVLPVMDTCAEYVTEHCGTHLHVGMSASSKSRLNSKYYNVLGVLVDHMVENEQETVAMWGRYFTSYARNNWGDHYNWLRVNESNGPTVEFRLAKFHSSTQYLRLIKFCRSLVKYLNTELSYPRSDVAYNQIAKTVLALYLKSIESMEYETWVHDEEVSTRWTSSDGYYEDDEDEDYFPEDDDEYDEDGDRI